MDYVPVYYVLHSSLSLDICCKVDRLELPGVVTEEVLAVATSGSNSNLLFDSSSSVTTRLLDEGELLLTAQVYCNGQPMHQVALATHTPSRSDAQRCTIEWYDLLRFPLRYRDIASDANIIFFVWGVDGGAIGGARLPLFDENGALRQGKQKLEFTWLPPAGSTESPVALTSSSSEMAMLSSDLGSLKEFCSLQNSSSMDPSLDREDHAFHLEKLMEAHELGDMPRIGWLDRMTLERARQLLDALRVSQSATMRQPCWSDEEWELRKRAFLVVDLPSFGLSVAHEEQRQSYPGSTAGGASMQHSIAATLPTITQDEAMSDGWPVPLIADFEVEDENPLEIKYRKLAHNILRGLVDPDLKPNREERERIDAVINSHSLGDHLRVEEKDLLWKFRHCLTDNKKALTKFLLSVDWTLDAEVVQVPALLAQWHQRAPIDVSDALKLLGRERAFQAKVVRDFAVDALERSSDSQLLAYLLQLVQALRYQPSSSSSSSNFPPEPETFLGVVDHDVTDLDQQKEPADSSSSHNSPLAQLLIRRACNSLQLASFLFWYLYVEQSDATHGGIFRSVFSAFQKAMSLNESSAPIISMLRRQKAYVSRIATVHKEAATTRGRKPQKEAKLRELLQNPSLKRLQEALPFPLDPSIRITGLQPESAFMFKSALYPCVIDFSVTKISKDKEPYCDDEAMTEPPGDDATGSYKVGWWNDA
jgi:phosphatidylinositol 3-kinase